MPDTPIDRNSGADSGAGKLLARAAAADVRGHRALLAAIDDFVVPDDARLDERTRTALSSLLHGIVDTVEAQIREHGARLLGARQAEEIAGALLGARPVFERLAQAGLLHDPELIGELIGQVREDALSAALPAHAPEDPERPSLINRFAQHPDGMLAEAAKALLLAESRRRVSPELGQAVHLPAELHHRLVWGIAAALRLDAEATIEGGQETLDRALCDAAERCLAGYDEGDRLEAAAMRLAAAIDAQPRELGDLLVEALDDRRIILFAALLANAIGMEYGLARALILDATGDRLWLALRAFELPREPIARIGYALCEADPRRDLEQFADTLDAIEAIDGIAARAALAPLRLPQDFRAALLALETAA